MKIFKIYITIFFIFSFVACSEKIVVSGVDQKQANEIVSVLAKSNIISNANTDPASKKLFAVFVNKKDYIKSVSLLTSKGFPKEKMPTFSELVSHRGLLPDSKKMESLRFDKALSVEIEESILTIPNISSVNVVVRNEYKKDDDEPSVSILIVTSSFFDNKKINDIKNIVQNSLPQIKENNIKILITEESYNADEKKVGMIKEGDRTFVISFSKFLGHWDIATKDYKSLSIFFAISLIIVGVFCFILGYYGYAIKNSKRNKSKIIEASSANLLLKNANKKGGDK